MLNLLGIPGRHYTSQVYLVDSAPLSPRKRQQWLRSRRSWRRHGTSGSHRSERVKAKRSLTMTWFKMMTGKRSACRLTPCVTPPPPLGPGFLPREHSVCVHECLCTSWRFLLKGLISPCTSPLFQFFLVLSVSPSVLALVRARLSRCFSLSLFLFSSSLRSLACCAEFYLHAC